MMLKRILVLTSRVVRLLLQEGVEERARAESVNDAGADQVGGRLAVDQGEMIAAVGQRNVQVIVRLHAQAAAKRFPAPVPELTPVHRAVAADPPRAVGRRARRVGQILVVAGSPARYPEC